MTIEDGSPLRRPCPERAPVAVPSPGDGPGFWTGGPSAVRADDGTIWLAYRLRRPVGEGRGYANVIARSADGTTFDTVSVLRRESFACDSLERPALVALPGGGWRLYVSCATPGSRHWRVDALDAVDPSQFDPARAVTVFSGDETVGVKDPVIQIHEGIWHAWVCCHPLDLPDDTDRMTTAHATSHDGQRWEIEETPTLAGSPGGWDERGARVADVVRSGDRWWAYYDGRATKEENAEERTGFAVGDSPGRLVPVNGVVGAAPDGRGSLRYISQLALPDGGTRLFYETSRRDGAHDLRTEYVPPTR